MPYLELKTPQGVKRLKLAETSITVGRLGDNVVVLADELASRHHCIIELQPLDALRRFQFERHIGMPRPGSRPSAHKPGRID